MVFGNSRQKKTQAHFYEIHEQKRDPFGQVSRLDLVKLRLFLPITVYESHIFHQLDVQQIFSTTWLHEW